MVSVTPEVSSSAVLIVGSHSGPMAWKGSMVPAGEAVTPAAVLGQAALKSGHRIELSRSPSAGTECARIHHSAVKKAPKNITSEKMNQLMLQRNEWSTLRLYWPASLSWMASRNHWNSTPKSHSRPNRNTQRPQPTPLIHWVAPKMTKNRPNAAKKGCREGCGTK